MLTYQWPICEPSKHHHRKPGHIKLPVSLVTFSVLMCQRNEWIDEKLMFFKQNPYISLVREILEDNF